MFFIQKKIFFTNKLHSKRLKIYSSLGNTYFIFFQEKQIIKLCNFIPLNVVALGLTGLPIHYEAVDVCQKYKLLFQKYGKCHKAINCSKEFDEPSISELGNKLLVLKKENFL